MRFVNLWTELLCKPCLITPQMHGVLCDILLHKMNGEPLAAIEIGPAVESEGLAKIGDNIANIVIDGVIGKHVSGIEKSSGVTDVDDLTSALEEVAADPAIEGVLLDVNSPGGGVTGVPEAAKLVAKTAQRKPVVAYTDDLMASAAYWLAAGADAIYASQSANVGSIGVYMAWLDESKAYEMQGVKTELIKRGKFKGMGIQGTSLTDEQRAHLQAEVDTVYDWFRAAVTARRKVPQSAMEGQTFYAQDAKKMRLVDRVGSRDAAIKELRALIARKQ